jgi:hypothetical protein
LTLPDGAPTEWKDASANVPAKAPFVVFTQGDNVDTTKCESTDVEIQVMVDWGKKEKN